MMVADGIAPECKREALALRSKGGGLTNSVSRPWFKSIVEKVSLSPNIFEIDSILNVKRLSKQLKLSFQSSLL